jgi:hypothetical protein
MLILSSHLVELDEFLLLTKFIALLFGSGVVHDNRNKCILKDKKQIRHNKLSKESMKTRQTSTTN